jgi:hypothetical protein
MSQSIHSECALAVDPKDSSVESTEIDEEKHEAIDNRDFDVHPDGGLRAWSVVFGVSLVFPALGLTLRLRRTGYAHYIHTVSLFFRCGASVSYQLLGLDWSIRGGFVHLSLRVIGI